MTVLTDHEALASMLVLEKRALEDVHDSHVQLRLLLEAGDSRYLGWAVDDLVEATGALTAADRARRSVTGDHTAEQCIETAPIGLQRTLVRLTDEIDELLRQVSSERSMARSACHVRIQAGNRQHR